MTLRAAGLEIVRCVCAPCIKALTIANASIEGANGRVELRRLAYSPMCILSVCRASIEPFGGVLGTT